MMDALRAMGLAAAAGKRGQVNLFIVCLPILLHKIMWDKIMVLSSVLMR